MPLKRKVLELVAVIKIRMVLRLAPLLVPLVSQPCIAQSTNKGDRSISLGLEQDVLPYLTGGYYAAGWVGASHLRARFLLAHVHKPAFVTPKGFINNTVTAYALVGDYFIKEGWTGLWVGGGIVLWKSTIQSTTQINTAAYDNYLLNGSFGYNWKFGQHLYLSPWAGLHLRVGGARQVTVDGTYFTTPFLNPEASVKLGWYFGGGDSG